jgi:competence protein ComEC
MQLLRLPWLALAFAAGIAAAALAPAAVPGSHLLGLAGASLLLSLTVDGLDARARLVLVLICAGGVRMAVARLDVERTPRLPAGVIADDRGLDTLVGTVAGPVEDRAEHRAFLLALADAGARDGAAEATGARVWVTLSRPAGQAEAAILPGDHVRVRGRLRTPRGYRVPGAADARLTAAIRGARFALATRRVEVLGAGPSPWRWPARVQRWAAAELARGRDAVAAAAARGMIAGDRGGMDTAASERFRDAGVAHVLSVSGLHLAVVALLWFAAVRRAWAAVPALATRVAPARVAALVAAPAAIGFAMMTGAQVATMRALLVVLVVLAGAATVRRARMIDALGLAALLLLAAQPLSLFDPSFQLSFAATATLALAPGGRGRGRDRDHGRVDEIDGPGRARPSSRAIRAVGAVGAVLGRAGRALRALALASLWTTLATAPFTALAFGMMATGGLVANLAVVPLTELVIVPVGLVGLVLAAVWPAAGALALDLAVAASAWVVAIADATAALAPVLPLPPPDALELAACGLLWAAAIAGGRAWWPRRTALALAGLAAAVLVGSHAYTRWLAPAWRDELRVTFLDVGQGDAAVLELPGGAVWMIDSGGLPFVDDAGRAGRAGHARELAPDERQRLAEAPGAHAVARFLAARRIGRIDIVVLSHPHPDHYEGLRAVARSVDIGEVWTARPTTPDHEAPSYRALVRELEARGARIVHPLLDAPVAQRGVVMTALAPRYLDRTATADPVLSINDDSLVVRIDHAGRMLLFAGDIEREGEEILHARHGRGLRADVVKVPHHGSKTSSTARFVRATSPALAVISCGVLNRFDFPAARVVARWQAQGAAVLRTDLAGALTVVIAPGGAMRVSTIDPP